MKFLFSLKLWKTIYHSGNYTSAMPNNYTFLWLFFTLTGRFCCCQVKKSGLIKNLMILWFLQSLALSQRHHGVSLSVSPGGPVPSKASCGGDCCGLLQLPLPSEIDELIVGLLPVCLCPGWRRPGYGWESQLWHLPWGYYCSCPAGGPGGWWPWEKLWPTYCCHTPGDTAALSLTWSSDWLR